MFKTLTYEVNTEGYALITLRRPETRNAVSRQMVQELDQAIQSAKQSKIKCLVLTGDGEQAFCSGGDLHDFHGDLSSDDAFQQLYRMKEVLYNLASFSVPTIAFLNGPAMGGGCELATACDFRFAREDVTCGFIQGRLGITPGWGGGALLYHRIDPNLAFKWLVESKSYNTVDLQNIGWLHGTFQSTESSTFFQEMLKPYLEKSLEQLQVFKKQYMKKMIPLSISVDMDEEVRNCANLWNTEEHHQAVSDFFSRGQKK